MKLVRLFSISMIALSSAFMAACGPQEADVQPPPAVEEVEQNAEGVETEIEQEVDPRFEALEGFTLDQRAEFEQELNTMIQDFDLRISDLEAQSATLDEATQ